MYKLYGSLGSASLAPHCVLEASGVDYEFVPVDISCLLYTSPSPRDS